MPILGRPILWYGFFFALGFFLGYLTLLNLLKHYLPLIYGKKERRLIAERVVLFVVLGTVIGARLGDVFFYQDPSSYLKDPWAIFRVWEGGLASHGGTFGVILALFFCSRALKQHDGHFTFLKLLDLVSIPTPLVAACIRVGNFFNQEILGKEARVPWAVTFGHPADGSMPVPRHPVQLYEALYYLLLFGVMLFVWRKTSLIKRKGAACGLLLLSIFAFRFVIEFFKEEQSMLFSSGNWLTMGQWLSIPFIFVGAWLLFRKA